ncbi:MAG: hypothetical protein M1816_004413 [Peltula sp. TS41687]|nr:MAG: hypothetical protein M1816_004413 [Peltula sp. TS41687]
MRLNSITPNFARTSLHLLPHSVVYQTSLHSRRPNGSRDDEYIRIPASQPCEGSRSSHWDNKKWELTVGLEIHAHLNTERKLFSEAATSEVDVPNSHVSSFDAALPGSQPHLQSDAIIPALRAGLALDCRIENVSRFDRKHYLYRDQPAGYQITQYHEPLGRSGRITVHDYDGIAREDGKQISVEIKQIQLEQDTAKSLSQPPSTHLLDFNRVSHPLLEIVTLPQIHHPSTAAATVRKIQSVLRSVNACTSGMEMGGLRVDVNISVRRRDALHDDRMKAGSATQDLGQRTEIKNLCSYKAVEGAIEAERNRQVAVLEAGGLVTGETRGWTLGGQETRKLRGKEGEVDYRFLPEPDLQPIVISQDLVQYLRETLPMQPDKQLEHLTRSPEHSLNLDDAEVLVNLDDGRRLDYYEAVRLTVQNDVSQIANAPPDVKMHAGKMCANWVLHELGGLLATSERKWHENPVLAADLAAILIHLLKGQITGQTSKYLLCLIFRGDSRPPQQIIEEQDLFLRTLSHEEYEELGRAVLKNHESLVKQLRIKPKMSKIHFLVGQMVRCGKQGTVEALKAEEVIRRLLEV